MSGCGAPLAKIPHFLSTDPGCGSARVCGPCAVGRVSALLRTANRDVLDLEQALRRAASTSKEKPS
jgi:hypothetical protein